jgi:hypothetical protein
MELNILLSIITLLLMNTIQAATLMGKVNSVYSNPQYSIETFRLGNKVLFGIKNLRFNLFWNVISNWIERTKSEEH